MQFSNQIDRDEGKVVVRPSNSWFERIEAFIIHNFSKITGKKFGKFGINSCPAGYAHWIVDNNSYSIELYTHITDINRRDVNKIKKWLAQILERNTNNVIEYDGTVIITLYLTADDYLKLCQATGEITPRNEKYLYNEIALAFVMNRYKIFNYEENLKLNDINLALDKYFYKYSNKYKQYFHVYLDADKNGYVLYIVFTPTTKEDLANCQIIMQQLNDDLKEEGLKLDLFVKDSYSYLKTENDALINNFITLLKLKKNRT